MKKVLMVIPFFPPMAGGGVYRPLAFVRNLPGYGWEPTVVAPRGDAFWIRDERLLERVPESVRVVRTDSLSGQSLLARFRRGAAAAPKRSSRGFGALRRLSSAILLPDSYIGWYPHAAAAVKRLMREVRFDAVYSTSPPETSHLVAARRAGGVPWVADFRDPWMNLQLFAPPTAAHAAVHRRLEAMVCRRAAVVVTTRWHEHDLRSRYPSARVYRIGNGFDGSELSAVADAQPAPGPMRIVHAGMLTQQRTAVVFLRALSAFLERRPDARRGIAVTLAGPREDSNDRAVADLGLGDIVDLLDSAPHDEVLKMQASAHVLLLIKHLDPAYRGMVPGKMYEYIGLRRPVLALAPDGEARATIEALGRGETVDPDDEGGIAAAIERMYERHRAGTLEEGYDLSPRPEFDRAARTGELARVLDEVTA
jgi:glycosyltransferase involved in cell wall biosynthesis